ncbi:hypothetical protein [Bradyrhizobium erythrophlei]|uniref:Uncharacterized protein n=1 Tax=Bradyrhizobium erythrophlei TaxID=1437360 RepID=A0A1M5H315_9BRAD|nr:hypothetical protein [Bradyrhizobium erythrophlei]SHG10298.1 hypothetical protein SAMN05443248_0293 [Bradyrhizobium erythrophlei]
MADLNELATAVDDAEDAANVAIDYAGPIVERLIAAKREYFDALRQPWLVELEELHGATFNRRPSRARLDRLRKEMDRARRKLASLNSAGLPFYTQREYLEAEAAEEAAEGRHEFARRQYFLSLRDAPTCVDVDGVKYVRTGFKKIAGERKEIWEKVT